MASYSVEIKRSAVKELESIPAKDRRRVVTKIQSLVGSPRPAGCEKLSGQDRYRIRQGNYRILYTIEDDALVVTVMKIGDRRDVYRE